MAESKVSISNQALVKCGANTISSFTDGSHEANTCSTMYDNARDGLLYYTFWNFAVTKQALSLTNETPVDASYTKVHTLPGDIIRVKGMVDKSGYAITDYSIESNKVYSNTDPLNIEYVQRLDESNFPVFFIEALIAKLAAEINESITGVGSLTRRLTEEFQLKLRASRIADGQENPSVNIVPAGRLVEAHIGTNSSLNGRLRHPTS
mgnify:FL=1|tara:strand:- start:1287 stop:1907 length:621 start_codon:yes stop_codon:yes gene_type:complete